MKKAFTYIGVIFAFCLLLTSCAEPTVCETTADAGGFWWGLWNGMTFPFSFIGSLFNPDIVVYDANNNGGWYDFGFFLGVGGLGTGLLRAIFRRD